MCLKNPWWPATEIAGPVSSTNVVAGTLPELRQAPSAPDPPGLRLTFAGCREATRGSKHGLGLAGPVRVTDGPGQVGAACSPEGPKRLMQAGSLSRGTQGLWGSSLP